jgi:aspartate-semialdehyde dehydrogenase
MVDRIPVTILGATGVVGQRFARRLAAHPWFEVRHLAASDRSTGKRYRDACAWRLSAPSYAGLGDRMLLASDPEAAFAPVVFSALDADAARTIEPAFAAKGAWVFTNASAFRMEPDVPLLIPEVNASHLGLVEGQRRRREWKGAIVANPNCTATVLALALAPLHAAFGIEKLMMTSMQAASGAGYPGVASLDILGNVYPFIRSEEGKVEEETPKLLGAFENGAIRPAPFVISAACHRVPVVDGHTESVSVALRGSPGPAAVREAFASFRAATGKLGLPSAPPNPIRLHDADDRPQVRLDVEEDGGMAVHVGRIRECKVLGIKFLLLGHNAERGAAGASVLNAELARARGLLTS